MSGSHHDAHAHGKRPRWVAPEDIPMAVLVIPATLGISIVSWVIGAVILY